MNRGRDGNGRAHPKGFGAPAPPGQESCGVSTVCVCLGGMWDRGQSAVVAGPWFQIPFCPL